MVKLADRFDSWAPITAEDAAIRSALASANIPALMCALVHLTGDPSLLRGSIKPSAEFMGDPQGGISEADQARMREAAFEALVAYRDGGQALPPAPSLEVVREMIDFIAGQPLPEHYGPFLLGELGLDHDDPYAQPALFAVEEAKRGAFHVLIIGAGMSGLLAGYRLKQAGVPFTIVEKNPSVGGTWFENTYPGCRVDSPNHTYSYSFAPNDWPQHFSAQPVLLDYFRQCAEAMGVLPNIRFNREVTEARYDAESQQWVLSVKSPEGTASFSGDALLTATGQLNRPRMPEIEGMERFSGPSWHSARWNHEVDLTGKRVAVVGTGASAFQFVPHIAKQAASVTIFQRTPPWVSPQAHYFEPIEDGKHWLLQHVPFYAKWFRFSQFWSTSEGLLGSVRREPGYENRDDAVGEANDQLRAMLTEFIHEMLGDRPDLIEKVTPHYPPAGKRMLVDNGTWYQTLKLPHIEVLTDRIARFTEGGLETESGVSHDFDVVIYATGFHASKIVWPMAIYGRTGENLQDLWDGDPRAYLGITVPDFPNFFMTYGPNTNIVVNGSIVFFSECEIRYILGCLALSMEQGRSLAVKHAVHDSFNEAVDRANEQMAWGAPHVNSWYKNAKGRVTQNWPFTLLEYWNRTRAPAAEDFEFFAPEGPAQQRA